MLLRQEPEKFIFQFPLSRYQRDYYDNYYDKR